MVAALDAPTLHPDTVLVAATRCLHWLTVSKPNLVQLLSIWAWRSGLGDISGLPSHAAGWLRSLDVEIDHQAEKFFSAIETSGSPGARPLDDWTRDFYARHNRPLPEGWS